VHYYERTASGIIPRHYVEMSSRPGELRPTRITDVRKWIKEGRVVKPSVTTIQDCLAKPALINWKVEQYLKQAFNNPQLSVENYDDWLRQVKQDTEMAMEVAPQAGTDFHELMQLFFQAKLPTSNPFYGLCSKVHQEILHQNGGVAGEYRIEENFVSDMGYGGQIDLITPCPILVDYKTKQTADKFKPGKMVYPEHSQQLAAYRKGVDLPNARCCNLFVCLEDGQIDFYEHTEQQLEKGWKLFEHCMGIWYLLNE